MGPTRSVRLPAPGNPDRPEPRWWQRGEPHARGSAADGARDWGGAAARQRVTGTGTAASGTLLPRPAGRERECVDPTLGAPGAGTCSLSRGREDPPHSRDSQRRSPQGARCPSHAGSGGDPQKSGRVVGPEGPGVRPPPLLSALQTVRDFGGREREPCLWSRHPTSHPALTAERRPDTHKPGPSREPAAVGSSLLESGRLRPSTSCAQAVDPGRAPPFRSPADGKSPQPPKDPVWGEGDSPKGEETTPGWGRLLPSSLG